MFSCWHLSKRNFYLKQMQLRPHQVDYLWYPYQDQTHRIYNSFLLHTAARWFIWSFFSKRCPIKMDAPQWIISKNKMIFKPFSLLFFFFFASTPNDRSSSAKKTFVSKEWEILTNLIIFHFIFICPIMNQERWDIKARYSWSF